MRTNKSAVVFVTVFLLIVGGILIVVPSEIRGAPGTIYVNDDTKALKINKKRIEKKVKT